MMFNLPPKFQYLSSAVVIYFFLAIDFQKSLIDCPEYIIFTNVLIRFSSSLESIWCFPARINYIVFEMSMYNNCFTLQIEKLSHKENELMIYPKWCESSRICLTYGSSGLERENKKLERHQQSF